MRPWVANTICTWGHVSRRRKRGRQGGRTRGRTAVCCRPPTTLCLRLAALALPGAPLKDRRLRWRRRPRWRPGWRWCFRRKHHWHWHSGRRRGATHLHIGARFQLHRITRALLQHRPSQSLLQLSHLTGFLCCTPPHGSRHTATANRRPPRGLLQTTGKPRVDSSRRCTPHRRSRTASKSRHLLRGLLQTTSRRTRPTSRFPHRCFRGNSRLHSCCEETILWHHDWRPHWKSTTCALCRAHCSLLPRCRCRSTSGRRKWWRRRGAFRRIRSRHWCWGCRFAGACGAA